MVIYIFFTIVEIFWKIRNFHLPSKYFDKFLILLNRIHILDNDIIKNEYNHKMIKWLEYNKNWKVKNGLKIDNNVLHYNIGCNFPNT
jgi:hypothetical protein